MLEYKCIGDICSVHTGSQLNRDNMIDDGLYPVINGGRVPSGYTNNANESSNKITISQGGESAGFVNWIETEFWAGAHCYVLTDYKIEKKFLYHLLKEQEEKIKGLKQGAGIPGINKKSLLRFSVPVPPLSRQKELVGILDTFTSLVAKLDEEIELRKQQLVYYHNHLIDELVGDSFLIGNLFDFKNGLNKEKKYFGEGTPIVNYTDVYHYRYLNKKIIKGLVTLSESEIKRYAVKRGDVFFTRTSETQEEVGFTAVMLEDIPNCTFSGFLLRARPKTDLLLPEYCKYCFSTNRIRTDIIRFSTYTTRALTNGTSLSKIKIPLPCKEKQLEIVEKLDTFTSLISKLQEERDLRQKQYEYYREKLLTFE